MTDINYNPGIVRTVKFLQEAGYETTDSGDGYTNVYAGMEYALDYPHVAILVDPDYLVSNAHALKSLLENHGIKFEKVSLDTSLPAIQSTYDPVSNIAIIIISGVNDEKLFK